MPSFFACHSWLFLDLANGHLFPQSDSFNMSSCIAQPCLYTCREVTLGKLWLLSCLYHHKPWFGWISSLRLMHWKSGHQSNCFEKWWDFEQVGARGGDCSSEKINSGLCLKVWISSQRSGLLWKCKPGFSPVLCFHSAKWHLCCTHYCCVMASVRL